MTTRFSGASLAALCIAGAASAQVAVIDAKPLPPLAHPDDPKNPAKELFARKPQPANMEARSIGFYTRGCLAGGIALPINGKTWQVMRLSRQRNFGHPELVAFMERHGAELMRLPRQDQRFRLAFHRGGGSMLTQNNPYGASATSTKSPASWIAV